MERTAVISDDGLYRYRLTRVWDVGPWATFVMLNPSTADSNIDDPTIRRCIGFARGWGCGGLVVVNVYALRSTDPRGLWAADDPVGPENDRHIIEAAHNANGSDSPLVAAWGANAKPERVKRVLTLSGMDQLDALGVTKAGAPRHPLYMPGASKLKPWPSGAP